MPTVIWPITWRLLLTAALIAALIFVIDAQRPISHALFVSLGTGAWAVVQAKLITGVLTGAAVTLVMALGGGFERTTALLAASWFFWTVLVSSRVLSAEAGDAGIRWVDELSLVVLFISVFWIRWLKSKAPSATASVIHA